MAISTLVRPGGRGEGGVGMGVVVEEGGDKLESDGEGEGDDDGDEDSEVGTEIGEEALS